MSYNPCYKCKNALVLDDLVPDKRTKYYPHRCNGCEKYRQYHKYKLSKRKYKAGKRITTIEQLLKSEWLIFGDTTRHREVILNTQMRTVLKWIDNGMLFEAVRKDDVSNER